MNKIPFNTKSVVATLRSLFHHQQKNSIVKILENAEASIMESDYDSWDGGTYYYTLYLDVQIELFASIESNLSRCEKEIESKLPVVLRGMSNCILNKVVIRPIPVDELLTDTPSLVTNENLRRVWGGDSPLRLFISHQNTNKNDAVHLKCWLAKFKVAAFVAHEDIEPTLPWQREIKFALNTMDACVVLLTPQFRESKWTDQEIGFAVARKVLIIHVRDGLDPYGFIGETQSLSVPVDFPEELSSAVVNILIKDVSTSSKMREALFAALENSNGHKIACKIMKKIELLDGGINLDEVQRIKQAANDNLWVGGAYTVKDYLGRIEKDTQVEDVPF